jgi:hypothetical protein
MTSYAAEASDTLRTAQGKGVPACRPGSLEPYCCHPGCPDCSPVSPIGRTHQEAAEARKRKREATAAAVAEVEEPSGVICGDPQYLRALIGGDPEYLRLLDELRALHIAKSSGYGTGEDPLANFMAVAAHSGQPAFVYPVLRAVEKLSRWASLYDQGRLDELEEEHLDVASLLLCAEALRRSR